MNKNLSPPELLLDMGQSMYRFSWAMTLIGTQQAVRLMNPLRMARSVQETAAAFDAVSRAVENQLDAGLGRIYRTGESWALAPLGQVSPELRQLMQKAMMQPAVFKTMSGFLPAAVASIAELLPDADARIARLECEAKLEVMQLVQDTRALCPPLEVPVPLGDLVDRCYELGSYPALWAIEGIGHYLVESHHHRDEPLLELLTSRETAGLPEGSLTMLHAGLGLAFAEQALEGLSFSDPIRVDAALERFEENCRKNCRPGFLGCALESLGLVARHFYGDDTVRVLDEGLSRRSEEARGYFWHGVGRALYFSPGNLMPGLQGDWPAVAECDRLATHDEARKNLVAGVVWGLTMVNLKQPEVLESFLTRHEDDLGEDDAFHNGVMSSLVMRTDTTPDDDYLAAFLSYEPRDDEHWWSRWVGEPARRAVREIQPRLRLENKLETVFRYRPIADLGA